MIESTRADWNPLKLHVQAQGPGGLKLTPIFGTLKNPMFFSYLPKYVHGHCLVIFPTVFHLKQQSDNYITWNSRVSFFKNYAIIVMFAHPNRYHTPY